MTVMPSTVSPGGEAFARNREAYLARIADLYARGFGADALVRNAYRLGYLRDAQANPDGGFPTVESGQPPASPAHPLRRALKRNDLRGWTPSAPVLLCGGSGDPTVYWFNTELIARQWSSTVPATVLDVDAASTAGDPYRDYRNAFAAARTALRLRSGESAVLESYHAGLVAPVCLAAVRAFFDAR